MRRPFKIMLLATALVGASMLGASTMAALAAKPLGLRNGPHGDVRPAPYWQWTHGCRGGRYYTYLGGWGCDYYAYSGYSGPRR
jgi:hypothetical protein